MLLDASCCFSKAAVCLNSCFGYLYFLVLLIFNVKFNFSLNNIIVTIKKSSVSVIYVLRKKCSSFSLEERLSLLKSMNGLGCNSSKLQNSEHNQLVFFFTDGWMFIFSNLILVGAKHDSSDQERE